MALPRPTAPHGQPEGDYKFVLFSGFRLGSDWPHVLRLYHCGEVRSVELEWPAWLPYVDLRKVSPAMVGAHPRWPILVGEGKDRIAPGSKVAAFFTNDPLVQRALFKKGWIDVSSQWHEARARHAAVQQAEAEPAGPMRELVETITTRIGGRSRSRAASGAGI